MASAAASMEAATWARSSGVRAETSRSALRQAFSRHPEIIWNSAR